MAADRARLAAKSGAAPGLIRDNRRCEGPAQDQEEEMTQIGFDGRRGQAGVDDDGIGRWRIEGRGVAVNEIGDSIVVL